MKRVYILFLLLAVLLVLSGCEKEATIVFPFAESDVESIETYYDNGESEIQKKTITDEANINYTYSHFSEIPTTTKKSPYDGGRTVKFVFNLAGGTSYELTYIGVGVKNGRLKSEGFDYFTISDVAGFWDDLPGEIELISPEKAP